MSTSSETLSAGLPGIPYVRRIARQSKNMPGVAHRRCPDMGPWLAVAVLLVIYAGVAFLPTGLLVLVLGTVIFVIFLVWPERSILLLLPSLLPCINLELGNYNLSFLRIALMGALLGHVFRRKWIILTRPAMHTILMGWGILILALFLSSIVNGYDQQKTWYTVMIFISRALLFVLVILACKSRHFERDLPIGWSIFGLFAFIASFYVLASGGSVLTIRGGVELAGGSLLGVAGIWLAVSSFSVNAIWATLGLAQVTRSLLLRFIAYGLAAAFFIPMFMSGRRQAILAFALSLLAWLMLSVSNRKTFWGTLLSIILGGAIIFSTGFGQDFFAGRQSIHQELEGKGTGRKDIYLGGIQAFLQAPILGNGPGSYLEATEKIQGRNKAAPSHNTVIGVAAESGLFGLLGLTILILSVWACWWKLVRITRADSNHLGRYLLATGGVALAGLLVSNLLEYQGYLITIAIWPAILGSYEGVYVQSSPR